MGNKEMFIQYVEEAIQRPGIENLLDWLENETDFFVSPASTRFHGSYEGGLCEHSLNVYEQMLFELDTLVGKGWESVYDHETIAIIALFHDICKVGRYQIQGKWRKDERGEWESYEAYVYNPDKVEMGHGPQSVYYLQKFIQLTEQEATAIFWHMGAYDISPYANLNGLSKTNETNPLAFLIQRADMASTYAIENKNFVFAGQSEEVEEEAEVEEVKEEESVEGRIIKKAEVEVESEVKEEAPAKKEPKKSRTIRAPKPVVEEEQEDEDVNEEENAVEEKAVVEGVTYWYSEEDDMFFIVEQGDELPDAEEISKEDYMDAMFPILEEDFFYLLPDETVGVIKAGERLPEDYDEQTFEPITEEEYLERTAPKKKPTVVAKASKKTPSPSRRPRP